MNIKLFRSIQMMFLLSMLVSSSCSEISSVKSAKKYIVGTWYTEYIIGSDLWRVTFSKDGSCELAGISANNLAQTGWYNSELLWRGPWDAKKVHFADTGEEYFMAIALFIDDNGNDRPWEFNLFEKNLIVMSNDIRMKFEKE